jgi:hypothetical protein
MLDGVRPAKTFQLQVNQPCQDIPPKCQVVRPTGYGGLGGGHGQASCPTCLYVGSMGQGISKASTLKSVINRLNTINQQLTMMKHKGIIIQGGKPSCAQFSLRYRLREYMKGTL